MKKLLFVGALFTAIFVQTASAQDKSKPVIPTDLLSHYYQIKDALVAGDAKQAASNAAKFIKSANSIDTNKIAQNNINALVKDADNIIRMKILDSQREHFANLSINMATVAKAVKLTTEPVYYVHCPMKKTYWLSKEKAIKNPYYGSSMLTCGEVTEIIR